MNTLAEYVEHPEDAVRYTQTAISQTLGELALDKRTFVVIGGASLVLRGIVANTLDLDLLVNEDTLTELWQRRGSTYVSAPWHAQIIGATNGSVHLNGSNGLPVSAANYMNGMGIYPLEFSRLCKSRNQVNGYPCISLKEIIRSKQTLRRPKDIAHLEAIKRHTPKIQVEIPHPVEDALRDEY